MIHLLLIFNNVPPLIKSFDDVQHVIDYAKGYTSNEGVNNLATAKHDIVQATPDLHTGIWIVTRKDYDYAKTWKGHQHTALQRLLANDVNPENLKP